MNVMNERCNNILNSVLLKQDMLISSIAKKYKVTNRTIKNDIDELNLFLKKIGQPSIQISLNGKLYFKENYNSKRIFSELQKNSDYYNYKLSPNERRIILIMILLNAENYMTINNMSKRVFVGRTTLIKDMHLVKIWFENNNLKLESVKGKGYHIKGPERIKRRGIFLLIKSNCNVFDINQEKKSIFHFLLLKEIKQDLNINNIELIIKKQEMKNNLELADYSYKEIIYYLIVITNRLKKGKIIEEYNRNILKGNKYNMALGIMKTLCEEYGIQFYDSEVAFLNKQLQGKSFIKNNINDSQYKDAIKIQMLVIEFLYRTCQSLNRNKQFDYSSYTFLMNHIETMISRMQQNDRLTNPFKDQIKSSYLNVFDKVKEYVKPIENYTGYDMNEDEISYIVMHIVATIERQRSKDFLIKVLLVCETGLGTALLLKTKLKKHFNIAIVDVISSHKLCDYDMKDIDLIVSTTPIEIENQNIKNITVNAIPNQKDICAIRILISHISKQRLYIDNDINKQQKEINDFLNKYVDKKHIFQASNELNKIFKNYFNKVSNNNVTKNCDKKRLLYQLLTVETIDIEGTSQNWEDAVRESGNLLLKQGFIEQQYVDAMVENIRTNGPYIVVTPHVAMPHAMPKYGSNKLHASLLKLKKPVVFNHKENDPVKFIFCVSILDNESHLKAFFNLIRMTSDKKFMDMLEKALEPNEIISLIQFYETNLVL